jgi:hypothetical protein
MTVKKTLLAPKRLTRAEVQHLGAEFVSSGVRRSEFFRSRGLSFGTLNRHLKKQPWKRKSPRQHETELRPGREIRMYLDPAPARQRSRAASSAGRLLSY